MTGDRSLLKNFIEKFMGAVRFGNDHFAAITGYGDYVQGNITICHVYYVEGLGHNLFSVGQFCDGDLEVAFRSNTCYVRNLDEDDLLTGAHESNLYTISILDMVAFSPPGFLNPPPRFEPPPSTQPLFVNIINNTPYLHNNAPPLENIHHPPNLENQYFPNPPNILDFVHPNDMPRLYNMVCQCCSTTRHEIQML
ncbi:hypothetical protein Tco_1241766 [Tanacetum coccineum]